MTLEEQLTAALRERDQWQLDAANLLRERDAIREDRNQGAAHAIACMKERDAARVEVERLRANQHGHVLAETRLNDECERLRELLATALNLLDRAAPDALYGTPEERRRWFDHRTAFVSQLFWKEPDAPAPAFESMPRATLSDGLILDPDGRCGHCGSVPAPTPAATVGEAETSGARPMIGDAIKDRNTGEWLVYAGEVVRESPWTDGPEEQCRRCGSRRLALEYWCRDCGNGRPAPRQSAEPAPETCPTCSGHGIWKAGQESPCPTCNGTGEPPSSPTPSVAVGMTPERREELAEHSVAAMTPCPFWADGQHSFFEIGFTPRPHRPRSKRCACGYTVGRARTKETGKER